MPSDRDALAERWHALAAEARACAAAMMQPEARRIMQEIAAAYDVLARRATVVKDHKQSRVGGSPTRSAAAAAGRRIATLAAPNRGLPATGTP